MTEQYSKDLSNWDGKNIFLNDKEFMALQMSLVAIKTLNGSYETYCTQIKPHGQQKWKQVVLFPGTAFKFCNKLNAEFTAKSILTIMEIKNIPTKIHVISHRMNPVYPEAETDTLEMLQILIEDEKFQQFSILTWSAGCSYLQNVYKKTQQLGCKISEVCMISPVVDLLNKKREKRADFLNEDFFYFVQKVYCGGDTQKVNELSLMNSINNNNNNNNNNKNQERLHCITSLPLSIIYGSQQYIKQDIEQFIKLIDESKTSKGLSKVDTKIIANQNHALFSFVTTLQTRSNQQAMSKIAKTKWQVSKYIADMLANKGCSKSKVDQLLATPEQVQMRNQVINQTN